MAAHRFCVSLKHAAVFLDNLTSCDGYDDLRKHQIASLATQLTALPLDMEGAATVTTCINEGSWSAGEKQTLNTATSKRLSSKPQVAAPSNRNQRCLWFERYLCDVDWTLIQSNKALCLKVAQIIYRAGEINLVLPCENTLARMLSVLLGAGGISVMSHKEAHAFCDSFKETAKKDLKSKKAAEFLLWEYPMDPSSVSEEYVVYKAGREPSMEYEKHPAISTISKDLVLRSNNSKLKAMVSGSPPARRASTDFSLEDASGSVESMVKTTLDRELGKYRSVPQHGVNNLSMHAWKPTGDSQLALCNAPWSAVAGEDAQWDNRWYDNGWSNQDDTWKSRRWWADDTGTHAPGLGSAVGNAHSAEQDGIADGGEPKQKKRVLKRPAGNVGGRTAAIQKKPAGKLVLGCSKCKFGKGGCKQCRNPKYSGWRGKRGHFG